MFFYLNLRAPTDLDKIEHIYHAFIGSDRELAAILVCVVTADVLPMLSPHVDGRLAYVPQAQHLGAPVDELVRILRKLDGLCGGRGSNDCLQQHAFARVIEQNVVVRVVDEEKFTAVRQFGRLGITV